MAVWGRLFPRFLGLQSKDLCVQERVQLESKLMNYSPVLTKCSMTSNPELGNKELL